MWDTTPQERLALGVIALLLAVGAGVRMLRSDPPPAEWAASIAADSAGFDLLRDRVDQEVAAQRIADTPLARGERIDPNTADVLQLQRLPRVGPALAERIVAWREANGRFRSLTDLDRVSGIGPAMLEQLAPHVTLPAAPPSGAGPTGSGPHVDINRASAEELDALPGIGPVLAERIVEWRRENGRFRDPDDLEAVSGIGPALRARLEPLVRIRP